MDITIYPGRLSGTVHAVSSKSYIHRAMICAALSERSTEILCHSTGQDIKATADCLRAIGAKITEVPSGFLIVPAESFPNKCELYCRESGSTLRFMLPICGALGIQSIFHMQGKLASRPLSPLLDAMERMGCRFHKSINLQCSGKLKPGNYRIPGNISSQFVSGLLFGLSLLKGKSILEITGRLESESYVKMTQDTLRQFAADINGNCINGSYPFHSPGKITIEGDWSNAAFFIGANILGSSVCVKGLNEGSIQGDRQITHILPLLSQNAEISAADIPDLIPILAVVAAASHGARFTHINRLRIKESNRVAAIENMLHALGCASKSTADTLTVFPGSFHSCLIDSCNDHRIAMAASIAATAADGPVTIGNAECVAKSDPDYWNTYKNLGGNYEQHIR